MLKIVNEKENCFGNATMRGCGLFMGEVGSSCKPGLESFLASRFLFVRNSGYRGVVSVGHLVYQVYLEPFVLLVPFENNDINAIQFGIPDTGQSWLGVWRVTAH